MNEMIEVLQGSTGFVSFRCVLTPSYSQRFQSEAKADGVLPAHTDTHTRYQSPGAVKGAVNGTSANCDMVKILI